MPLTAKPPANKPPAKAKPAPRPSPTVNPLRQADTRWQRTVRYGWDINPDVNLVNAEGLPAATFRSDGWPMATGGRR